MQFIAWLLIGTVILAYVYAFLDRYGHFLLVLTGEVLLGALVLVVIALITYAAWSWFCRWWELRHVRARAARAIQRTNVHCEKSRPTWNKSPVPTTSERGSTNDNNGLLHLAHARSGDAGATGYPAGREAVADPRRRRARDGGRQATHRRAAEPAKQPARCSRQRA